jgi:hypothetical protein
VETDWNYFVRFNRGMPKGSSKRLHQTELLFVNVDQGCHWNNFRHSSNNIRLFIDAPYLRFHRFRDGVLLTTHLHALPPTKCILLYRLFRYSLQENFENEIFGHRWLRHFNSPAFDTIRYPPDETQALKQLSESIAYESVKAYKQYANHCVTSFTSFD